MPVGSSTSSRTREEIQFTFCWSGQHYADNLKDVFIRDLELPEPDIELGAGGSTDAEVVASVISRLSPVLRELEPDVAVFLGDTNTVMGCLAAAQLNIPIVHIEGLMRSYDWRMPEEKYRTVIDHLSDVIYTYFDEYKEQGVREGINPRNIVVIQNLIVDVLNHYYFDRREEYERYASAEFFAERNLEPRPLLPHDVSQARERRGARAASGDHGSHRPEPVAGLLPRQLPDPATTQGLLDRSTAQRHHGRPDRIPRALGPPRQFAGRLDRLGHGRRGDRRDGRAVAANPQSDRTASGLRLWVERQVRPVATDATIRRTEMFAKLDSLHGQTFDHGLGDGHAAERLVADLVDRVVNEKLRGHLAENSHIDVSRSYREDGLPLP